MRGRSPAATLPVWVTLQGRLDESPMRPPRAAPHGGSTSSRACSCWLPAVSLYVLLPTLASVLASWRSLSHLDWPFAVLAVACEAASFVCLWELDRIGLGARARFPIACAQLAGNAAGRIVPGAPTPVAVEMLRRAGFDAGRATAALTASTALQLATTAALPLLALPVIVGGASVSRGLASAAYLGIAVLLLLLAAGTAAFAADRPLELAGRGIQWLLNATVRRDRHVVGLPQQLLADRDFIRTTLGGRWKGAVVAAAANTGFDYLALLCALRAAGAAPRDPRWSCWPAPPQSCSRWCRYARWLGLVEAGLVGTLKLAGVPGPRALAATLLYRLVAYWLPIPAGGVAFLLFRRRYH